MSGTSTVTVGDRGRVVLPADLRERAGLAQGTVLALVETPDGIVMMTREQLREVVRRHLAGADLVAGLLADRRAAAAADDLAS